MPDLFPCSPCWLSCEVQCYLPQNGIGKDTARHINGQKEKFKNSSRDLWGDRWHKCYFQSVRKGWVYQQKIFLQENLNQNSNLIKFKFKI